MGQRIVVVVGERKSGRGGVEAVIGAVVPALAARGHRVCVALVDHADNGAWEIGLPNLRVGPGTGKIHFPLAIAWFTQLLRDEHPDAVIATDTLGALLAGIARRAQRTRPALLSWLHSDPTTFRRGWALRLCDAHMTVSEGIAAVVGSRWGTAHVVYNPVGTAIQAVPRPGRGEDPVFLYVGRLAPEKRVGLILQALAPIADGWRLRVVGDGSEYGRLQALAHTLGCASRIEWTGWKIDPWNGMDATSALILTSETEGFGMVLIEAAARGVPLIAMDCPYGPREIVNVGNGWLVPNGDTPALTTLLRQVVARKIELPEPAVVAATVDLFSLASVVSRMEATIGQAIARSQGRRLGA